MSANLARRLGQMNVRPGRGAWLAVGVGRGVAFGAVVGSLAVGIAVGVVGGLALGARHG